MSLAAGHRIGVYEVVAQVGAQLWYQDHFDVPAAARRPGAPPEPQRTRATCRVPRGPDGTWPALDGIGMFRTPSAGVILGDVALTWYMRQGNTPLAGTRGHLMDHVAVSVTDLDRWTSKLSAEGVTVLGTPYALGRARAVLVEGPSRETIELVEIR